VVQVTTVAAEPIRRKMDAAAVTTIVVAALAMVATLPGRSHGLGLITNPLLDDLGIDRVALSAQNVWATLLGALFCFPAGRMIDRYGLRITLAVVSALLGLVVIGMSLAHSAAIMFWLIMLTRGLGQSALSVVSIALIGKSFDRKASWPAAIYSLVMTVGFMFAFPVTQKCVAEFGWRSPWGTLGAVVFLLAPLSWILLRRMPTAAREIGDARPSDDDHTLGEALSTSLFWILAGSTSMFGLISSGLGYHQQDYLTEHGLVDYYAQSLTIGAPFGLLGQALCGWMAKRMTYQMVTMAASAVYGLGTLGTAFVSTPTELYMAVIVMAISGGILTVVFFGAWPRFFGQSHLGLIQGAAQMTTVVASAVGPLMFALSRRETGSYSAAIFGLAAVMVGFAVAACFSPTPNRHSLATVADDFAA
jgi:MFS family permease